MSDVVFRSQQDGNEQRVLREKRGQVLYITLNRPHYLNAMDSRMHEELCTAWDEFEGDDALRLAVICGAGSRAFSVGQDLRELVELTRAGAAPTSFGNRGAGWPRLTERHRLTKPVLAKVNGLALGGGFELALACDIIVASENAEFALPEARFGLIPGAGGVFRLSKQIPFRAALGYLLTGRRISATRAMELGLVNEVIPSGGLDECVNQWITDILSCSPLSVRAIKEVARVALALSIEDAFSVRYKAEEDRLRGNDHVEGPKAFVEKRVPNWR